MNEVTILAPNEVVEQLEASERLPQDIDPDTLRKYFTLTRPDLEQVDQCRGAENKLGFAVQLCTLRWRGHFLRDTREIPEPVLETLSLQLGVLPIPIDDYLSGILVVTKEVVGIHVLLTRSLFGDGTPRRLLPRVSLATLTSAPLRF